MGLLKKIIAAQQGALLSSEAKTITTEEFALVSDGTQYVDTELYLETDNDFIFEVSVLSETPFLVPFAGNESGIYQQNNSSDVSLNTHFFIQWSSEPTDLGSKSSLVGEGYRTWYKEGNTFGVSGLFAEEDFGTLGVQIRTAKFMSDSLGIDGALGDRFIGKGKSLKIWSDATRSTLRCDEISVPAGWRAEEGADIAVENCMWCKVRKEYFYNQGTGVFGIEQIS